MKIALTSEFFIVDFLGKWSDLSKKLPYGGHTKTTRRRLEFQEIVVCRQGLVHLPETSQSPSSLTAKAFLVHAAAASVRGRIRLSQV